MGVFRELLCCGIGEVNKKHWKEQWDKKTRKQWVKEVWGMEWDERVVLKGAFGIKGKSEEVVKRFGREEAVLTQPRD